MVELPPIKKINDVLADHFKADQKMIPAKELMPAFIKAGIFSKDHKAGLPIRRLLRFLDRTNQLGLIPYVLPIRKAKNVNWYFAPIEYTPVEITITIPVNKKRTSSARSRLESDEAYVVGLCEQVLEKVCIRQHTFPFLVGDKNRSGYAKKLPVDAWFPDLNLVIEYHERQHSEPVGHFDKRVTISGVSRGEQRSLYDQRKLQVLSQSGITVVVISYHELQHNTAKRLLRREVLDLDVVKSRLKPFLQ